MRGYTIIELIIAIFIIVTLASLAISGFRFFNDSMTLDSGAEQIVKALNLTQNRTLASVNEKSYGVHFENGSYVVFSGTTYDPLEADNETFSLSSNLEIANINLVGGGQEVIFDRVTGKTSQNGVVTVRLKKDLTKEKIIFIEPSGRVGFDGAGSDPVGRVKDSRHVHFNYDRFIDLNNESISLVFYDSPNPNVIHEIIIKDNINLNGQLDWHGTIDVNGSNQSIEIKTHELNNATTTLSVRRDRRINNKALGIFISGEAGYGLIDYDATGTTTKGSSAWVSEPEWQ